MQFACISSYKSCCDEVCEINEHNVWRPITDMKQSNLLTNSLTMLIRLCCICFADYPVNFFFITLDNSIVLWLRNLQNVHVLTILLLFGNEYLRRHNIKQTFLVVIFAVLVKRVSFYYFKQHMVKIFPILNLPMKPVLYLVLYVWNTNKYWKEGNVFKYLRAKTNTSMIFNAWVNW